MNKKLNRLIEAYFEKLSAPTYVWEKIDGNFQLIHYNKAAGKSLKENEMGYLGINASEFYKKQPEILKCIKKSYRRKKNITKELEIELKHLGASNVLRISCTYLPDLFVIVRIGVICSARELEKELRISETKYRHLFEKSPLYILLIDKEWNIIDCNSSVKDILGYNKEELIGSNLMDVGLIDPKISEKLMERTDMLFEKKSLEPIEMKIRKKSGEKIGILSHPSFISYNDKKLIQLLGRDITGRKEAEIKSERSKRQLQKISEELKVILDNVPALIYYKDTENNIIRVNKKYADSFELTPEEIAGKNTSDIHPEEMAKKFWEHDLNVIRTGKPEIDFIEPIETPRGPRWILNSKIPIKDDRGEKVIGIIGFGIDITNLRQVQKDLKINEEKFKKISEAAQEAIYLVDSQGMIQFWNNAAQKTFGFSEKEAVGNSLDQLIIPPEKKVFYNQNLTNFRETGNSSLMEETSELTALTKDKRKIYIEVSLTPIKIENKWNTIAIARDITERKQIEESLRESEEIFRTIAERADMGIMLIQDKKPVYINRQYSTLFGYTKEEMMNWRGSEYQKCVHPDDHQFVTDHICVTFSKDEKYVSNYEFRAITKSGGVIWLDVYSNTIHYKSKRAILITLIDVTDRKRAELALKKSERRYRKAYELANLYKDLFAHDINNILQNIKSAVQLEDIELKNRDYGEKISEYHNIIEEQIVRGTKLVSDVRKLSKLESIKDNLKPVSLLTVLRNTIEYIKNSFKRRGINLKVSSFQEEVQIKANEFLSDVFENILINAVKYNEGEQVIIDINITKTNSRGKQYIKMEFKDNGIGISDKQKKLIFQTQNVKGKGGKGMGFGLTLVNKIIQSLDGEITVEDRIKGDYTQGTNFIVKFPYERN